MGQPNWKQTPTRRSAHRATGEQGGAGSEQRETRGDPPRRLAGAAPSEAAAVMSCGGHGGANQTERAGNSMLNRRDSMSGWPVFAQSLAQEDEGAPWGWHGELQCGGPGARARRAAGPKSDW